MLGRRDKVARRKPSKKHASGFCSLGPRVAGRVTAGRRSHCLFVTRWRAALPPPLCVMQVVVDLPPLQSELVTKLSKCLRCPPSELLRGFAISALDGVSESIIEESLIRLTDFADRDAIPDSLDGFVFAQTVRQDNVLVPAGSVPRATLPLGRHTGSINWARSQPGR